MFVNAEWQSHSKLAIGLLCVCLATSGAALYFSLREPTQVQGPPAQVSADSAWRQAVEALKAENEQLGAKVKELEQRAAAKPVSSANYSAEIDGLVRDLATIREQTQTLASNEDVIFAALKKIEASLDQLIEAHNRLGRPSITAPVVAENPHKKTREQYLKDPGAYMAEDETLMHRFTRMDEMEKVRVRATAAKIAKGEIKPMAKQDLMAIPNGTEFQRHVLLFFPFILTD